MLSVIIPTCNRNDLLSKCLDCLTLGNKEFVAAEYEIIVTDDGRDNQAKTLLLESYPMVRWIEGPKRGPAANRNCGAEHAKFDWLIFIDDDCLPSEGIINCYYQAFIKGDFFAFEGAINADRPQMRYDEESPLNLNGGCFWSCNIAVSRTIFLSAGGFDEGFPYPAMEDTDFQMRILEKTPIKFVKEAVVIHPWRRIKAFTSYKSRLSGQKYFREKYFKGSTQGYRFARFKILVGSIIFESITLAKYSFRGTGFFLEKLYFNFLMIFN